MIALVSVSQETKRLFRDCTCKYRGVTSIEAKEAVASSLFSAFIVAAGRAASVRAIRDVKPLVQLSAYNHQYWTTSIISLKNSLQAWNLSGPCRVASGIVYACAGM